MSEVFDLNFKKISRLVPLLPSINSDSIGIKKPSNELHLICHEKAKYTGTYSLTHIIESSQGSVNRPDIRFKIYFDAKLLEVDSICKETRINSYHPLFDDCSDLSFQLELNIFMLRWLDYCLDRVQWSRMDSKKIKSDNSKLVIAISSRALFNLDHSHKIFKEEGIEAYARHQQENEHVVLEPGVGFTLVKKLLKLNSKKTPIDVILLSRNSADTGLRIFNSIEHYGLNISRAAFTRGESTHPFVGAFEADLFLIKQLQRCSKGTSVRLCSSLNRGVKVQK